MRRRCNAGARKATIACATITIGIYRIPQNEPNVYLASWRPYITDRVIRAEGSAHICAVIHYQYNRMWSFQCGDATTDCARYASLPHRVVSLTTRLCALQEHCPMTLVAAFICLR